MLRLISIPLVLSLGCDGRPSGRTPLDEPELASLALSPPSIELAVAERASLSAIGTYTDGSTKDLSTEVSWRSSDLYVATVSGGMVAGVAAGMTTIEVKHGTLSASAPVVVVTSPIVSIAIDPAAVDLEVGETASLVATAMTGDGATMDVTAGVSWSSSDATVVEVEGGVVTARAPGSATIAAKSAEGVEGTATVSVATPPPSAIVVSPSGVSLPIGETQAFTARADLADGSSTDVTALVAWESSSLDVATVDASGVATAIADGFTSITAVHPSGVRGSVSVRVTEAAIVSIDLSPASATIGLGASRQLTAEALYTDGSRRDVTSVLTWETSDANVATVGRAGGAQGLVEGVGPGSATISGVHASGIGGSAAITVTPAALESILVIPNASTLPLGSTLQLTAYGLYSDRSSRDLSATAVFTSSDVAIAVVDAAGFVTTVGQGTVRLIARDPATGISSEDASQSASLQVTPPALVSIAVSPSTYNMVTGTTQQFVATGRFSNGTTQALASVSWSSSSPAVTIAASGLATAVANGTATIVATDPASGISSADTNESAQVTVADTSLVSIAVTPTSTAVPVGADVQFRAIGTYANAATADLTASVTWVSSSPAMVRPQARGMFTTMAAGSVTVSAVDAASGISSDMSGQSASVAVMGGMNLGALRVTPSTAMIDVGDSTQLHAIGVFTGGATFDVTNAVSWSSSGGGVASVGNVEGSRGLVTGLAAGVVTISAVHGATGVASNPSAQITVDLGIVTLAATYPGPTVEIDATAAYGVSVGSVTFTGFDASAVVTNVSVTINFLKTDGSCATPASGNAYHSETSFRLQSPAGTQVILASPGTWSGGTAISPVAVTFDEAAASAPSGTPVSGTFLPNGGSLGTFDGTSPSGTWILQAGDAAGGDPLCVQSYTISITAQ
jgi:hypothetical protein